MPTMNNRGRLVLLDRRDWFAELVQDGTPGRKLGAFCMYRPSGHANPPPLVYHSVESHEIIPAVRVADAAEGWNH
jgi:hypothetical protein